MGNLHSLVRQSPCYHAELDGEPIFLVMELIDGLDLHTLVTKKGPVPAEQAVHFIRQAALGLQHAHEKGLVHRDIKPHNLMVTRKGQVKILDFGLAKLTSNRKASAGETAAGMMMGTPDYLAPEQSTDAHQVDNRADLYGLGCTLWFLLTGKPPFQGATPIDVILSHHGEDRPYLLDHRPDAPEDLARLVRSMMAKGVGERPQTAYEVAKTLQSMAARSKAPERVSTTLPPVPGGMPSETPMPLPSRVPQALTVESVPRLPLETLETPLGTSTQRCSQATAKKWGYRWRGFVGAILLGLSVAALAVLISVVTPDGKVEVQIKINEPGCTVTIDGPTLELTMKGIKDPIKVEVVPGQEYLLRVEKDGFQTETKSFTYRRGKGKPEVEVTLVRKDSLPLNDNFISLFNGKDLEGWKVHPKMPNSWTVDANGQLVGKGDRSFLFSERDDYRNFHVRAEAMINDGGDSGLHFRTEFAPDFPQNSCDAQIQSSGKAFGKTGSLGIAGQGAILVNQAPPPDEWFTLEVLAIDNNIEIKVNGKTTVDAYLYGESARFRKGHLALQVPTGKATVVKFRKIEIKEWKGNEAPKKKNPTLRRFEEAPRAFLENTSWRMDEFWTGARKTTYPKIQFDSKGLINGHNIHPNARWWEVRDSHQLVFTGKDDSVTSTFDTVHFVHGEIRLVGRLYDPRWPNGLLRELVPLP